MDAVWKAWGNYLENHLKASMFTQEQAYGAIDRMIGERVANVVHQGGKMDDMFQPEKLSKAVQESAELLADALTKGDGATLVKYKLFQ